MKHIVSFDLDMTLLNHHDFTIPDSTMKALRLLRETYHIVLATGRDMDTYYSRHFRDLLEPDAIVHSNGTKVTVGDQLLYEQKMDKKLLENLLKFAEKRYLSLGVTMGDQDFYTHPKQVEELDVMRWGESGRQFQDPWQMIDMDVRTLAYVGEPDGAKLLEAEFPACKFLLFAGNTGADVVEKNVSKAVGLKKLCDYYGTSMKYTYAFGDSMNDYEMIRDVGVGVAMGNAIESLKEVADYVTTSIDCNGIWNACLHLQLVHP